MSEPYTIRNVADLRLALSRGYTRVKFPTMADLDAYGEIDKAIVRLTGKLIDKDTFAVLADAVGEFHGMDSDAVVCLSLVKFVALSVTAWAGVRT